MKFEVEIKVSGNDEQQITAFLAEIGSFFGNQFIDDKTINAEGGFLIFESSFSYK